MGSLRRVAGGRGGWARALAFALACGLAAGTGIAPLSASAESEPGAEIPLPDLSEGDPADDAAAAAEAARAARVVVLPPRVDAVFAPVREGLREWLSERAVAAGLELAARSAVEEALAAEAAAGRPVRHGADAPALAARLGAGRVLFSELHFERGFADLRLHLHAGADGRALAGAHARGRVAELSTLAHGALVDTLKQLGVVTPAFASAPPPQLSEWSALS
ncbi:MAG TPA: hypothetical protein VHQ66_12645, partial [Myxococcota bacterium]|nr:hypothetical protein [Myxococcota bacterium]